jgi:hypothetical protein
MLFANPPPLTKKEKKKALIKKRNRLHQQLFAFVRSRRKKPKPQIAPQKPQEKEEKKEVWSAKVVTIRNRLNNKKRASHDRWNRFAGTSDSGGRGL